MRVDGLQETCSRGRIPASRDSRRADAAHGAIVASARDARRGTSRSDTEPRDFPPCLRDSVACRKERRSDSIGRVAPALTIADVERIAALAHLELTADEKVLFTRQLAEILAYAEQVQAVDTSGVPATAHVLTERTERGDDPQAPLPRDEALAGAPDAAPEAGLFRVPRVIG